MAPTRPRGANLTPPAGSGATVTIDPTGPSTDTVEPTDTADSADRVGSQRRPLRSWLAETRGHGLWILAWSVLGWVGTMLAPALLDRPFLLMLLAPRALFVALAATSVPLLPFVLLGTMRLGATDASYYVVGRRFPRQPGPGRLARFGSNRLARLAAILMRMTDAVCRWLSQHGVRAGTVLFLRPNGRYLAVAGAYGVSPRVAGFSSVIGTMLYLCAFHLGLGALL